MRSDRVDLPIRERAEIERSAVEASHSGSEALGAAENQIRRYLNPPANTPYPLEYCFHLLGDVARKAVLDFGCGSGVHTLLLARRGADVLAFDISRDLIEIARRRLAVNGLGSARFFVSSAHDLALADASVDLVLGVAILHHLELTRVARELKRILRTGGRAIFQEPVRNSKMIQFVRDLIPYRAPDVSPFERPLTDEELRAFASGFSRYRSRPFWLPHVNLASILPVVRDYCVHPLVRLDGRVLARFPGLAYYASIRVIELVK
ncbi:MAG: class I SAM-dependent methyltransferase [Acidimicrobiia bacterium]